MLKIEILNNYHKKRLFFDFVIGFFASIFFSAFIYFEHFDMSVKLVNTLFGLIALAMFLYMPKRAILVAGFFIGIWWFYWIGYSFKYNGIANMESVITISFALIYMLFFGVVATTNSVFFRAVLLFLLTFFEPVDFNWLQLELLFVQSYIGVYKSDFALVLLSLTLPNYMSRPLKFLPLLLILFTLNPQYPPQKDAPLKIKLVTTDIKQNKKWQKEELISTLQIIKKELDNAILEGYDIVVLPESVFPFFMNKEPFIEKKLCEISKKITIVAGSLLLEDGLNYNVTYKFEDGKVEIAKKMILVPFGEYVPLPEFAKDFVNNYFFAGASDFKTATKPTDFIIKGIKFRNAICYEATCKELYDGDFEYMIASSNNAWFYPSVEPTIQRLLMKFYARKKGVTIYHSANWSGSGVVK